MPEVEIKVSVEGMKRLRSSLRAAASGSPKAMGAGLYAAGNQIMRTSKRLVPVDMGTLRGSGYVALPEIVRESASVELGYGGPAAAYAERQHERTEFNHPEGGQSKYLQSAVDQEFGGSLVRRAAAAARRSLKDNRGARRDPATPIDPNEQAAAAGAVAAFLGSFGGL